MTPGTPLVAIRSLARPGKARRRSGRPRDSQKRRLYRAEGAIKDLGWHGHDLGVCEEYIRRVWTDPRVLVAFPWIRRVPCPIVTNGQGNSHPTGGRRRIKLPKAARKESTALHEVAHSIVLWGPPPDHPGHGRVFARTLLCLVQIRMGAAAARALRESFVTHRVRYRRVSRISPARRVEMAAQARANFGRPS